MDAVDPMSCAHAWTAAACEACARADAIAVDADHAPATRDELRASLVGGPPTTGLVPEDDGGHPIARTTISSGEVVGPSGLTSTRGRRAD